MSPQTRANWLIDLMVLLSGLLATLSGITSRLPPIRRHHPVDAAAAGGRAGEVLGVTQHADAPAGIQSKGLEHGAVQSHLIARGIGALITACKF